MASIRYRPENIKKPWRVQIRRKDDGDFSKTFKTESEAIAWAAQLESNLDLSRKQESFVIPKLPLKIWIERYKTDILPSKVNGKKEFYFFEFWLKHLGNEIATDISSQLIESMMNELLKLKTRLGEGFSPESIRKYFMYLGLLYNCAIKQWKWATYNPITGVDVHRNLKSKQKAKEGFLKDPDKNFVFDWRAQYLELIKKTMKERDLSLRALARKSSMTLHTVQSGLDKECNPTLKYFLKLTKALGLKVTVSHE